VFDLRGYPAGSHELLLQRLADGSMRSAWWNVPRTIYPDRQRPAGWDSSQWFLEPRPPHIGGRVVFLTDARAISYAESLMEIVEHERLGLIVGRPTAGANGNVNQITLPGGYVVSWTGMQVLKQDGSQHHLVGIQPDVLVEHTVAAIRSGRDEDLETALDLVTGG
jgi:C-terminal processing protease CtpA/Prc